MLAALALVTCAEDPIGPATGTGYLRVVPVFGPNARLVPLTLDHVRIIAERQLVESTEIVLDEQRAFDPTDTLLPIRDLRIRMQQPTEDLQVTVQLLAGTTLLFEGTQTVTVVRGRSTDATGIPVQYLGPGRNIETIRITPRDTLVRFDGVVPFSATAADSQGAPVADFYLTWRAAAGTIDLAGSFTAPKQRGTVLIRAITPSGARDSTTVIVVPPPASLTIAGGDGQTAAAGGRLPLPLAVLVNGGDGQPVPGAQVSFAVVSGGGSVDSATATSDAQGIARSGAVLGPSAGNQSFSASAPGLAGVTFTATAGTTQVVETWTGAVSTDWSVAGNWSPAQVPGFLDSVVIGAAGRQPSLSTTTVTGAVNIIAGGNLTINGQGLSIVRGLTTGGTGVLTMTNDVDVVAVGGNARFDGGNELNLLSAGGLSIAGNLTQAASTSGDSYHPSGTHLTVLAGTAQTVSFATPGLVPGTSHFQDVAWVGTGTLTLLTPVMAHGTFVVSAAAASTIATPNGSRLTVGDFASVAPVIFNGVPLTLSQSTPGSLTLSNVTFQSMATNVSQLVVSHPGTGGGAFDFSNLVFSTTPVAPNGFYIDVTDNTGPTDGTLTINLVNPTPASGGVFIRQTNGAIVNWPSSAARTWTGAVSTDWSVAGNWSPAQVPTNADDVIIPSGTPNGPTITASCSAQALTVNIGASLNLGAFNCQVGGNVFADGTIVGSGAVQIATTAQIRGRFPGLILSGPITATGTLVVTGSLTLTGTTADLVMGGHRANITGNLTTQSGAVFTMTSPLDTVDLLGNATFAGGSTTGKLTAGVLIVGRSFTQSGTPTSFAPSGNHRVNFNSVTTHTITLSDPVNSRFQNLDVGTNAGSIVLANNVTALGQLIAKPLGTAEPVVTTAGAAGTVTLTAGGADLTLITLDKVPLVLTGGAMGTFTTVTFQNQSPTGTQLTVNNTGQATPFVFDQVRFLTTPTTGGLYLRANDLDGATPNPLVINLTNASPASGGALFQATNGAVVNWPAAVVKTWIGPSGGDWFTAANWSPAGVPAATEDVLISGATTVVSLASCPQGATARNLTLQAGSQINGACTITVSGNADVQGTIVTVATTLAGTGSTARGFFNGPVTVTGTVGLNGLTIVQGTVTVRGTLTLNGSLLIPNALDVGGGATGGRLVMTNPLDSIRVIGTTTFRGADETGFITAGVLDLRGDFVQAATGGSTASFVASGTNEVLFSVAGQAISFANPGASHFANLKMRMGAVLNTAATVTGTLIAPRADQGGFSGTGSLTVTGDLNVGTLTLAGVPLSFSPAGTATPVFDNVTFHSFSPGATQLTVNASGGSFTFNSLRFQTTPTTGFYLSASGPFTLNFAGPTPATGGAFVQTANGATVVWPAASTLTWTGTADNLWRNADNWSPAFVPTITTDVVIPAGTPFAPSTDLSHVARSLTLNTGATLNLGGFNLTVAGNAFADGQITSGGVIISATAQVRGRFSALTTQAQTTAVGRTVVGGNLSVNNAAGNLIMNGQTASVAGNLIVQAGALNMTNAIDSLVVTGDATFAGGATSGLLTQGVLVVQGNFTQQASVSTLSFAPSGTHKTVLGAAAARAISIGSPGAGGNGSHFQVLDVSNATGGLSLDVNMQADSLISNSASAKLTSPGVSLTVRRAQVSGLTLDNTQFILDEQGVASTENFSNVTFTGFPTTGTTMLTVSGPGNSFAPRPAVTTANINFQTLPIGAGNFYVDLTSTNSQQFTMTMTGSNQGAAAGGNGQSLFRVTPGTGIAVVNWP